MTGSQPVADLRARSWGSDVPISLHPARDRFADLIPTHLAAFKHLRSALSSSTDGRSELAGIGVLCHKIAGVAETLGFARAGDLAGRLDGAIDAGLASGTAPRAVWHGIDPMLEALIKDLEGQP